MGQRKSKNISAPELDQTVLRRITGATTFLPDEIEYFYYDFLKHTPTGFLTVDDFIKLYQDLFLNGLPEKFARYAFYAYDTNKDGIVDFEEFIKGLYYTTKSTPTEKIKWAFNLCDQNSDLELDLEELEGIIQALYELSDADMSRIETYEEAMTRVKLLLLTDQSHDGIDVYRNSILKDEFIDIVHSDAVIIKLIDCRPNVNKNAFKTENSTGLFRKHLKFKPEMGKSLSDSKLATAHKS